MIKKLTLWTEGRCSASVADVSSQTQLAGGHSRAVGVLAQHTRLRSVRSRWTHIVQGTDIARHSVHRIWNGSVPGAVVSSAAEAGGGGQSCSVAVVSWVTRLAGLGLGRPTAVRVVGSARTRDHEGRPLWAVVAFVTSVSVGDDGFVSGRIVVVDRISGRGTAVTNVASSAHACGLRQASVLTVVASRTIYAVVYRRLVCSERKIPLSRCSTIQLSTIQLYPSSQTNKGKLRYMNNHILHTHGKISCSTHTLTPTSILMQTNTQHAHTHTHQRCDEQYTHNTMP